MSLPHRPLQARFLLGITTVAFLIITLIAAPSPHAVVNANPLDVLAGPTRTPRPRPVSASLLRNLCKTNAGIPSAPAYAPGPGFHPAVILKEGASGNHPFNSDKAFKGLVSTAPQLAFCISPETIELIHGCYIIVSPQGFPIPAYTYGSDGQLGLTEFPTITIRVVVVQTGETIASTKMQGAITSTDTNFCAKRGEAWPRANKVTAAQLAAWVKGFVQVQ